MAYALSQFITSANAYSGSVEIDAVIQAGIDGGTGSDGFVAFFLPTGSSGATADGYLFKFDNASGGAHYPGRIYKVVAGVATEIGTPNISGTPKQQPYTAVNAARLTGAHHVVCHYRKVTGTAGKFSITVDGVLVQTASDNTSTVNGPVGYGYEGNAGYISRIHIKGTHKVHVLDQDDNALALIDFTKGHASKNLDNISDGSTRKLNQAHNVVSLFPTAVIDANGKQVDVADTITNTGASTASPFTDAQFIESDALFQGNVKLTSVFAANGTGAKYWQIISSGNGAHGINGYALLINTASGAAKGTIYRLDDGVITSIGAAVGTWGSQNNNKLHIVFIYHSTASGAGGKLSFYIGGVVLKTVADNTYQPNGPVGFACDVNPGFVYNYAIDGKQETPADAMDPNLLSLIDFTQGGHTGKALTNIADDGTYAKTKTTAISSGIPKKDILHLFSGAILDVDGVRVDVTNAVG